MAFDWPRFLDARGIEYATSGPNVAKGNIAIHCPFCGADDPSHHMSVSLTGRGWRCWRRDHRGKNTARLIQAILGCSYAEAARIAGQDINIADDWAGQVKAALSPADEPVPRLLKLPPEFQPFDVGRKYAAKPYVNYLRERGFEDHDIRKLTRRHGVYWCQHGSYHGRIMFTVYHKSKLVSWVGRSVSKRTDLRYKALTTDTERAEREGYDAAIGPLTDYFLWFDKLMICDAHTLVLAEGPFDALKLDVLGRPHGVRATCFFTSRPTERQVALLYDLLPHFKRRVLLLDQGTLPTALEISRRLTGFNIEVLTLPPSIKDPALITKSAFPKILLAA